MKLVTLSVSLSYFRTKTIQKPTGNHNINPIYRIATCQAQGCLVDVKVITVTQLSDLFSLPTFTYTTLSFFFFEANDGI